MKNWEKEYQNRIPKIIGYRCRKCGWSGKHLEYHHDIEITHPLNRHKGRNNPDLHTTEFQRCPNCKRIFYADGKPVGDKRELDFEIEKKNHEP